MDADEPTREHAEVDTPDDAWRRPKGQAPVTAAEPGEGRWRAGGDPPLVDASAAPPRRRGFMWVLGAIALAVVLVVGLQVTNLWPLFRNPFGQQTTDRSQPPLLKSIQDLSRYVAAEGNFQVVVDTQKNRDNVPDFLVNERTLFVGAGSVEAYVDFGKIAEGQITRSADGKSVEIKLPPPQLGNVNLDVDNSYVYAEQRGLINRLSDLIGGDPNRQQAVYKLAEDKIGAAARDSGLQDRAKENTTKMLAGLLRSLGYETIKITYTSP
jgi:hypothetical protein